MKAEDLKQYEIRRARDHELVYRLAATKAGAPFIICAIRKCRRDSACIGPMVGSRHMQGSVRAQQALGMSGMACAQLPRCIADDTDANFEACRTHLDQVQNSPLLGVAEKELRKLLQSRPWPAPAATCLLTSSPRRPTSDDDTRRTP